jgi:hypothetical protein
MALNKATDYEGMKGFDVDLQFGKHFEELLDDIFSGVHKAEVKTERDQWLRYGNIVIEKSFKDKPSGLTSTKADIWVHNLAYKGELICSIMIPVERLKQLTEAMEEDGVARVTKGGDGWKSKLTLIPLSRFFEYIIKGVKGD